MRDNTVEVTVRTKVNGTEAHYTLLEDFTLGKSIPVEMARVAGEAGAFAHVLRTMRTYDGEHITHDRRR